MLMILPEYMVRISAAEQLTRQLGCFIMLLSYFLLLTFAIARLVFHSIPFFLLFFGITDVALPLGQLLGSSALLCHIDGRLPLYVYNEVSVSPNLLLFSLSSSFLL
jgi:hypothetical protein